ncbi:MAG: sodium:solute symporter family protein, partial [Planctomycetota bacterium]
MPRQFGKAMMVMFGFGAGTHSDQAVGVASKSFSSGLSGIWYQWLWLPCTPFYWLIAPVMRRFRAITTGDVFEARYDRSVAILYAFIGMLNLSVNIGLMLKGSGAVISASTQGQLSANTAIAVMTAVFVVYGVAGGLAAAIITDFIQGILTVIFSFLLLPLVMNAVGWMDGIREGITDAGKLSLVAPAEIGAFYIALIAFNGLVGIVVQPHTMSNCAAGKTEMEGRFGWMFGNMLKRVCTVPWCLTGVAAIVYFGSKGIEPEPDSVFGAVAGDFLPKIKPGVLGVFLAALLASVMSSCDAFMIASAGLFTENIYRPLAPGRKQGHYLTVGRIASVVVVSGGVLFAFWLPGVVAGLEIFWKVSAMMGIAFWLGLFWRRTTAAGAWASTLGGFAIWFLTTLAPVIWLTGHLPFAREARLVVVKESTPSVLLHDCHLKDASSLARKLSQGSDPLSAHIYQQLSQETKNLLSQYDGAAAVSDELRRKLVADLNLLIKEEQSEIAEEQADERSEEDAAAFYDESRFAHVELSDRTKELIAKKPEDEALVRLNRRLLEESYTAEISRSWLFCACDLSKPVALADRINRAEDPVSTYVKANLSDQTLRLIGSPEADTLSVALASGLNRIAGGENIYDEGRFAETFASENTIRRAKEALSGEDLFKVNTYLLEEAFIWELSKNRKAEVYLPWQMVFYLSVGLVAGIVVSLLTKPVSGKKLDNFYALVRTPVTPGEQPAVPCTLSEDAVVP